MRRAGLFICLGLATCFSIHAPVVSAEPAGQRWLPARDRQQKLLGLANRFNLRSTDQPGAESLAGAVPGLRGIRPEQVRFLQLGSTQYREFMKALGETAGVVGIGATPHNTQTNSWARYTNDTHPHLVLHRAAIPNTPDRTPFTWLFDGIQPGWGGGKARFSTSNSQSHVWGDYWKMMRTFAVDNLPGRMLLGIWLAPKEPVMAQGLAAHQEACRLRGEGKNCASFVTSNLISLARNLDGSDPNNPFAPLARQFPTGMGGRAIHDVFNAVGAPDLVIEVHP